MGELIMNNEYRIVVDAGHGGVDPGAVNGNLKEKDLNLQAANYMYNRFKELGVPVIITRDSDANLSRGDRIKLMKTWGTDPNVIVLSNHINAGGGEGAEVVYPLRTSSILPKMILDEIGAKGQVKRKIYQRTLPENPSKDYYYIMRDTPNITTLLSYRNPSLAGTDRHFSKVRMSLTAGRDFFSTSAHWE